MENIYELIENRRDIMEHELKEFIKNSDIAIKQEDFYVGTRLLLKYFAILIYAVLISSLPRAIIPGFTTKIASFV
jgi:hypothetical protein